MATNAAVVSPAKGVECAATFIAFGHFGIGHPVFAQVLEQKRGGEVRSTMVAISSRIEAGIKDGEGRERERREKEEEGRETRQDREKP